MQITIYSTYQELCYQVSSNTMFSLLIYSHLKYRIYYGVWGVRDRRVHDTAENYVIKQFWG